jgi:hypothetical protein
MKLTIALLTFCIGFALTSQARAECTCQCVNGRMQPLCSSSLDLPPICPPAICPIISPSRPHKPANNSSARHHIVPASARM